MPRTQKADVGHTSRATGVARPAPAPRTAGEWQIGRLAGGNSAEVLANIDRALTEPAAAWAATVARDTLGRPTHSVWPSWPTRPDVCRQAAFGTAAAR